MKKALVSGYIGFNNFGDEAIFLALSTHLKAFGFEVLVLCNNKKEVKKNYNVKTFYYKNPLQILKALFLSNCLISGGGSLLQNKTSNFSLYYYLLILLFAKFLFKKTMIFAQGFEPVRGKINEFILKFVLKTVDFISVRDEKSKQYLEKLKIESILLADPVYSILEEKEINLNKNGLIIQLRNVKQIDDIFIQNLVKSVLKNYDGEIKLLPLQADFDGEICQKAMTEFEINGKKVELIKENDIDKIIEIINSAEFMISTRLHGAIVSNALKTKTFTFNYDEKLKTLTDELEIQNINLFDFNYDELDKKLSNFFNNEIKIKQYRKFYWDCTDVFLDKI